MFLAVAFQELSWEIGLITEIDGEAVEGELYVVRAIGEKKEGEITVTFVRSGQKQTVRVTPEEGKGMLFQHFEWDGDFPMPKPGASPAPMPLNQLFMPGRVV